MRSLRTLLRGVVDYAGLFPPAGLAMAPTVRNHAAYRRGDERWMLGRLVVPAARLDELEDAIAGLGPEAGPAPWRLAALVGPDVAGELAGVDAFNARHAAAGGALVVDAVELRAGDDAAVRLVARQLRERATAVPPPYAGEAYVEVPLDPDPGPLAVAAAEAGLRLKARTGGVTPDAAPHPALLLRFLARCAEHGVTCKATAGLHHALRGEHALTYEPGCARGTMHGFLNVLVAAALLQAGVAGAELLPLLEERDAGALAFDEDGVSWRGGDGRGAGMRAALPALAAARARGVASFGSCSFVEPVSELRALGLLPAD